MEMTPLGHWFWIHMTTNTNFADAGNKRDRVIYMWEESGVESSAYLTALITTTDGRETLV